jgi:cobalt-zinc-cadmium efflux system outer membrane protein
VTLLSFLLSSFIVVALQDEGASPRNAAEPLAESTISTTIWQRSPALSAARMALADAHAARSRLVLPNPTLAASWATIPLGRRNPPEISFWGVPNYSVTLGTMIELGKRGPRKRAVEAALGAAAFDLEAVHRQVFFAALGSLAAQAEAIARRAVLQRLAADGAETLRLQRARAEKGDVAGLEVDRLEVEHLRLLSEVQEAAEARDGALEDCTHLLGAPCPRIETTERALRFLADAGGGGATSRDLVAVRPDIQAWSMRQKEAEAEQILAARSALPDPSVTVSYQRDNFVASGNQAQSLSLTVAVPLPVFERGQADLARAARHQQVAEAAQDGLLRSAEEAARLSRARIAALEGRARVLDDDALPRARAVVDRTERAAKRGGVALQEVLLARRALEELQLDRVEVEAQRFRAVLDFRRAAGPPPRR